MQKTSIVSILFFLAFGNLYGQNWAPLTATDLYHFRLTDSAYVTHTIRVDSFQATGADTIFYLNRVIERHLALNPPLLLGRQGQFLGKTARKNADGSWVFQSANQVYDTSFVLWPQAGPGQSWVAGAAAGLSATVTEVYAGTVLGQADSLKTIAFSNGAVWTLSKNHGLVGLPDFKTGLTVHLTGIETRQLGADRLDRFHDFFTFNVGDVFEYYSTYFAFHVDTWTKSKYTVLEAVPGADTMRYLVRRVVLHHAVITLEPSTTITIDTAWWVHARGAYTNNPYMTGYNQQVINGHVVRHTPGGLEAGNTLFTVETPVNCGWVAFQPNDLATCVSSSVLNFFTSYRTGLGQVGYVQKASEFSSTRFLQGAVILGDTVFGAITPDDSLIVVAAPEPERRMAVQVYPNPTTGPVYRTGAWPEDIRAVEIMGADGRIWRRGQPAPVDHEPVIDLTVLPNGLYFVKFYGEKSLGQARVLKQE